MSDDEVDEALRQWRSAGYDISRFSPSLIDQMIQRLQEEAVSARARIAELTAERTRKNAQAMKDPRDNEVPLTVAQAIKLLQTLPPAAQLFAEGCDCLGPCQSIVLEPDGSVILSRAKP